MEEAKNKSILVAIVLLMAPLAGLGIDLFAPSLPILAQQFAVSENTVKYSLVVIGAGAAGLVIAIGATKAGKKVLLIEKGLYGGDCTNFGCIPSKALIASAHVSSSIKNAASLGIECTPSTFNADGSLKRVQDIVKDVRSHEDPEALAKNGSRNTQW